MVSAAGPSTAVLQHLLQLAVGQPHNAARFASHGADVGSSMATNNKQWEATGQQTVLLQAEPQQVQWQSAACEALQLFSLAELGGWAAHGSEQGCLYVDVYDRVLLPLQDARTQASTVTDPALHVVHSVQSFFAKTQNLGDLGVAVRLPQTHLAQAPACHLPCC